MSKVIVVTGGKGGIGKTTIALNLGKNLAWKGNRVLLVDADFGLRKLDLLLDLNNEVKYDIDDVISNKCGINEAILQYGKIPSLYLLPGSMNVGATAVSIEDFQNIIRMYRRDYDYVIVDCPAGVDSGFKLAVSGADKALVVIGQDISAVRDANRVIRLLKEYNIEFELVINYVNVKKLYDADCLTVDTIENAFDKKAFALIPFDNRVPLNINTGIDISRRAQVQKHFENLADRIIDPEHERLEIEYSFITRMKGFFSNIGIAE